MAKHKIWYQKENPKEPCPICHENLVEMGAPYCWECAKKKPLFNGD